MDFVQGDPGALMIVEFYGDSREELESRLDAMEVQLRRQRLGYAVTRALQSERQQRVWKFRKGFARVTDECALGDKKADCLCPQTQQCRLKTCLN